MKNNACTAIVQAKENKRKNLYAFTIRIYKGMWHTRRFAIFIVVTVVKDEEVVGRKIRIIK